MYEAMTREEALAYADKLGQRYKDADGKVRITLDNKTLQACTAMIEQGLIGEDNHVTKRFVFCC